MKILILHQHFKSPLRGGAIRSYYLAKALVERGHRVVVLTGHNGPYAQEHLEGIEVHWLPVAYENRFGFFARSVSFMKYNWAVVRHAQLYKDAQVCYALSVPLTIGLAAMWIKQRYAIPYFFEVGDLWPDAPIQMGFVRQPVLRRILYWLEKKIYMNAHSIVALSPAIRQAIELKTPGRRVHLVPNMADTHFYFPQSKDPAIEAQYGVEKRFVVSYIGAVGVANGLEYFLACARTAAQSRLPVHFMLCGEGAMCDKLIQRARQEGIKNLSFIPFQNREGVQSLLRITDAVFVCYKPVPILETGSPNKYFDGLAAGKLIVVNFGGWIREEIEKNSCGVYVDPEQPGDFVQQISAFLYDRDMLLRYQQAARALAEARYSREGLSRKFARIITGEHEMIIQPEVQDVETAG